jgi:hypothetical protein
MSGRSRQRLRREIEAAFADAPRPADDHLVRHPDATSGDDAEIAAAFRGKRWDELPIELLAHHHEAVFFLTPEAYRYFLPAYLIACVGGVRRAGNIASAVVSSLTPPRGGVDAGFEAKLQGFTAAQRAAIRSVLALLQSEGDPLGDIGRALRYLDAPT